MMQSVVVLLASCLLIAFAPLSNAFDWEFSCQVMPMWIRLMHTIDVSASNSPFVDLTLQGGAIEVMDTWLRTYFQSVVAVGASTFSNKVFVTGDNNNFCYKEDSGLQNSPVAPTIASITAPVSGWTGKVSVNDALVGVANMDWNSQGNVGRKNVFVYVGAEPDDAPTTGMPSFNSSASCETVSAPSVSAANSSLSAAGVVPIFVVPANLVDLYKNKYSAQYVIPQVADVEQMATYLLMALDSYYCFAPLPTGAPAPSTTQEGSTSTQSCTSGAVLEMVVAQDISHSYTNDLPIFRAKFPELFAMFKDKEDFAMVNFGLVSFSDKPFGPFGYPGDYCYREDLALTSSVEDFTTAVESLEILSGRDWKESQYSVMKSSVLSADMKWTWMDTVGGRQVLRVVVLATDSLAHDHLSAPQLPSNGPDCDTTNYPSPQEVGAAFQSKYSYPIVLSTPDIAGIWGDKVKEFGLDLVPAVVKLDQPTDKLYKALKAALDDACGVEQQRQASLNSAVEGGVAAGGDMEAHVARSLNNKPDAIAANAGAEKKHADDNNQTLLEERVGNEAVEVLIIQPYPEDCQLADVLEDSKELVAKHLRISR